MIGILYFTTGSLFSLLFSLSSYSPPPLARDTIPKPQVLPLIPMDESQGLSGAVLGKDININAPLWDTPLRMLVATAFVLGLTGAAAILGPHLSGLTDCISS
jgi:hypothetical protein